MTVQPYVNAEQWIKTEWSWLRANIALHPYLAVVAALFLGAFLDHVL